MQFPPDKAVMALKEVAPLTISQFDGSLSCTDNIREQYRGKHPVGFRAMSGTREELLDLIENGVHITGPWEVITPGELDVLRPGDALGHVAGSVYVDGRITRSVQDERRDADRRKDMPDVGVESYLQQDARCSRADCQALEASPRLHVLLVMGDASSEKFRCYARSPFAVDTRQETFHLGRSDPPRVLRV
jgi:hypothetical protein